MDPRPEVQATARGEPVELTDGLQQVLDRTYQEWQQATARAREAGRSLTDLCVVLAGEKAQVQPTEKGVRLFRAADIPEAPELSQPDPQAPRNGKEPG
jgi:hypothetical protein